MSAAPETRSATAVEMTRQPHKGETAAAAVAAAAVAAFVGLRILYLAQPWRIDWAIFPMFIGDEGAHGLMARHITEGARPIFYYGGYYHGAFDAYLSAGLFGLFGESLAALRALPGLFSAVTVVAAYLLASRLYDRRTALLAAALVAVPSKAFFEWGTLSLCGYCGYATMVVVIAALVVRLMESVRALPLAALGLVGGISIWSNQLSAAPVGLAIAALWLWAPMTRRDWLVLAASLGIGMAPLIWGNIETPFSTFRQFGRKALFAWTLTKEEGRAAEVVEDRERAYHALPLLEVLGAQPGRDGAFSLAGVLGSTVLVLGLVGAAAVVFRRRREDPLAWRRHLFLGAVIAVGLVMGIGGFSGQPIARYQMPLYPLLAVMAAGWLTRLSPPVAVAVVAVVVAGHAVDIVRPAATDEKTPVEDVIAALDRQDLRDGIAASPMYDVIFRSGERIVVVPLDHSRYVPYEQRVGNAPSVFYLYRDYQESKPAHRAFLRHLDERDIRYSRLDVGNFHVLYDFEPAGAVSLATVADVRADFRKEKFGR